MINGILDDLKLKYNTGTIGTKIIYINVLIFFTLFIIDKLFNTSISNSIQLQRFEENFSSNPWSLLTYNWIHWDFMHLIFNMILLYFVSQLFLQNFRDQNLLTFYIFGGIVGGLFFLLFPIQPTNLLAGSSASIYALLFAVISYNPKAPVRLVLIPTSFPILYIGYFFIALDVIQIILKGDNIGGSISHLGGMAFGYIYMKQFEKGNDFLGKFIEKLFLSIKGFGKPKLKAYTNNNTKSKPQTDYDFNHQKVEKQKQIDKILDKISRSGYESLSKEEKEFLFRERRT